MSCPVNLQDLPSGVFETVFTPENVRVRTMNSLTPLSFPKTRSALWDGSPAGDKLRLQLGTHRKPRLVLLEKALRLAQRHARHSNKPRLLCFLLGSLCVDADEEGVTVTLDRFDPGRDQPGASGRVPTALLPGDVLVPCLFSSETSSDAVVQSEAELHHCFKVLQQCVSGRQSLDLSHLLRVRGHVVCCQQSDSAAFSLRWSAVCPSVSVEVQPVRPVAVIPTALLRSLTGDTRPPLLGNRHRGFLTMDQTRKLLLLLESDPKASNLPLVGLWLSGVVHVSNPQVWAWCLRFLCSSALQDRVLSESGCFLLVLFGSTHRAPQFFQCRGSASGPQLDYRLLTASQCVTLYQQAVSVEGQTLRCELGSEDHSRQTEVFREALTSFNRAAPSAAGLSVSDQDSGVEDEDLSPRPSPSPHLPAQQARRVQPSVPELSLLIDSSFVSNHNSWQEAGSAPRPAAAADRKSAPATVNRPAAPPHLHSTPYSNLQPPCSCCSAQTYECTSIFSSPGLRPAHPHHNAPSLHPAAAPSSHPHTPPPPSINHPPVSVPPPSIHLSAPPPCPCSHPPPTPRCGDSSSLPSPRCGDSSSLPSPLYSSSLPSPRCGDSSSLPSPRCGDSSSLPSPRCGDSSSLPSPRCGDSSSLHPSHPAVAASVSSSCVHHQGGGVIPSDTYQLLLHQDRQLRLLQEQVQMLLEAQRKLQSSSGQQVDTQTPKSTASIAVGTGASLFWGTPVQFPLPHQLEQAPPPSSQGDLSVNGPGGGAENSDITTQEAACSPSAQHSVSGLQSPVLGESVSMYRPADNQHSFFNNLMTQVTSRLQESESKQEVEEEEEEEEEEESRRRSLSVVSAQSSRRRRSCGGDSVLSATVRQLQQLGVNVEEEDLSESDRRNQQTIESSSTLAGINPAAVVSRLSVSESSASSLLPGASVDLSLEANAIALRYLSDSQLSRLSLGGHAPQTLPASSSNHSLLSPSNMSLATRKYMRRYGLIEEEDEEEEEEDVRPPLLPQSQLIRHLRPKMPPYPGGNKANGANKENRSNRSNRHPASVRTGSRQTEGSVGNILDLSRLRQLPKLF
ncbi:SCL-interrupting locus protein homolog [Perca flavescens]|uniref:SCL-interrupting locus protein homolog n=1 Tax=Perca flavescens TaxID=8167 RepID=UPI00106E6055|nr:SCL-interrupting locus protein [Perca flavescens]